MNQGVRHPAGGHSRHGADPVAQRARGQDQRCEGDDVGVDHPLQPGDAAAQLCADRLDRHVDHAYVQLHHPEAQAGGQQRPAPPPGPLQPLLPSFLPLILTPISRILILLRSPSHRSTIW
jgi:hypothetical protein